MSEGQTHTRVPLPEEIEKEMRVYRSGYSMLPQSYIDFHKELAENDLPKMAEKHEWKVHATEMVDDGWLEGMEVLQAIVEDKDGNLIKIRWFDSQAWKKHDAGWSLI